MSRARANARQDAIAVASCFQVELTQKYLSRSYAKTKRQLTLTILATPDSTAQGGFVAATLSHDYYTQTQFYNILIK
jgi:hypothetical protein